VSERDFMSDQRKKVIYGREKHRNRQNKSEQNNRKVNGEKNRKVKRKKKLCCYFV